MTLPISEKIIKIAGELWQDWRDSKPMDTWWITRTFWSRDYYVENWLISFKNGFAHDVKVQVTSRMMPGRGPGIPDKPAYLFQIIADENDERPYYSIWILKNGKVTQNV